jgi:hypothetical protein
MTRFHEIVNHESTTTTYVKTPDHTWRVDVPKAAGDDDSDNDYAEVYNARPAPSQAALSGRNIDTSVSDQAPKCDLDPLCFATAVDNADAADAADAATSKWTKYNYSESDMAMSNVDMVPAWGVTSFLKNPMKFCRDKTEIQKYMLNTNPIRKNAAGVCWAFDQPCSNVDGYGIRMWDDKGACGPGGKMKCFQNVENAERSGSDCETVACVSNYHVEPPQSSGTPGITCIQTKLGAPCLTSETEVVGVIVYADKGTCAEVGSVCVGHTEPKVGQYRVQNS